MPLVRRRPYDRLTLGKDSSGRPVVVNRRTRNMLRWAEKRLGHRLTIVQGSYRDGHGAAASAGTHDGGGVVDLRTWDLPRGTDPQDVVRVLRQAGFAAWYRRPPAFRDPHIHAVAIGDRDLAPSAQAQVEQYRRGLNGLADHGRDDGPQVPLRTWEQVRLPEVSVSDMREAWRRDRRRAVGLHPWQTRRVQRALGIPRTGRWGRRTRSLFPPAGPTRRSLERLGRGRFRVAD